MKEIQIERTKKGLPALWEWGGGYTNTGDVCIIAGRNGEPLRPVYIKRRGHLACAEHALYIIKPGYVVVRASHHRRDFEVQIFRISKIESDQALLREEFTFSRGEWSPEAPKGDLLKAVETAKQKAVCYHCREPHYYLRLPEPQEEGVVM